MTRQQELEAQVDQLQKSLDALMNSRLTQSNATDLESRQLRLRDEQQKQEIATLNALLSGKVDEAQRLNDGNGRWVQFASTLGTKLAAYNHFRDYVENEAKPEDVPVDADPRRVYEANRDNHHQELVKNLLRQIILNLVDFNHRPTDESSLSPHELFKLLKGRHVAATPAAVANARQRLANSHLPQGSLDLENHIANLNTAIQVLELAGVHVSNAERVDYLLSSLTKANQGPNSWDSIVDSLRVSPGITYRLACNAVIEEARRRDTLRLATTPTTPASTTVNLAKSDDTTCDFCSFKHNTKDCRFMHAARKEWKAQREQKKRKTKKAKRESKNNTSTPMDSDEEVNMASFTRRLEQEVQEYTEEPSQYMTTTANSSTTPRPSWILDSGASLSVTNDLRLLNSPTKITRRIQVFKQKESIMATATGWCDISATDPLGNVRTIRIRAIFVKEAPDNILSHSQLDQMGISVTTGGNHARLTRTDTSEPIWTLPMDSRRNLYILRPSPRVREQMRSATQLSRTIFEKPSIAMPRDGCSDNPKP
jgi:hypothetical protein